MCPQEFLEETSCILVLNFRIFYKKKSTFLNNDQEYSFNKGSETDY